MSKKVLVVDDDSSILDAVKLVLEDAKYKVGVVNRGEQTYEKVTQFKPDVIVLDVLMSGHDGRTICKNLKKDNATKNIPIILTSAHPSAAGYAKKYGADDFLAKPFEVEDLIGKIEKQLKKS